MRKMLPLIAASLAFTAVPAQAERLTPEQEIARATEGRVAGEPVDCVDMSRVRSTRIVPNTAIIYDAGSVVYINRPRGGADSLDHWDTMVTRLHSSRLCSIDTVQLVDPTTRTMTGLVFLGDFVPYRRARAN